MELIFDFCVQLLIDSADFCGVTYKEMNVIVFVFIHPLLTVALFFLNVFQFHKTNVD